ncbi:protein-glutamate O-methyltransferase CheR [Sphingosinicella sp. BN140058]|uniref:CheR family methyltransferase n=1 Tax=Sphingosinicella sp. BN140058 TaxID=1892855 RepID=UPI0010135974|nr:protein-glutamate O-methyltransferase CheR [Sphingosinicella sp. BN140058]QAY75899.1 protein-glutamate O-methyltransferase CheR [Sphingosinicella sp. BN140058]
MTGEAPVLTPVELNALSEFVYKRTGMLFEEKKRYYIDRRIAERMDATGSRDFADYQVRLRSDPGEAQSLINSFTVNETYFYREEHQLRCLSRSILPEVVRSHRPGDLVRIWSLPCSTGEEPYSIALWLLENWAMVDVYNIEIVGSDIDTQAIAAALRGRYTNRSIAKLPQEVLDAYFEPEVRGRREIIQDLKESVKFTATNLNDRASVLTQGRFDVIFCRNLLIYFDEESRRTAAAHLYEALNPGGYLCLGHTESMSRISDAFEMRRFDDAIVYRRS